MNKQIFILVRKNVIFVVSYRERRTCFLMNKRFQNGDLMEGIAATANGYTTLKVFEKQAVAVPGPQKKKRAPRPAATASTSKGESLAANSNGYTTLKVYEKQPVTHAPAIKKKRGPQVPAATAGTASSKGKSLVSN